NFNLEDYTTETLSSPNLLDPHLKQTHVLMTLRLSLTGLGSLWRWGYNATRSTVGVVRFNR
ncbi:MAG: hypothetical protein ACK47M_19090, partial [Caldilinea sp.]